MKPVCVITGGGSGIGRATAKLVCEAGYHVILVGRTAAKLESAVAELTEAGHEAEAFACDLSDRSSCEKLARHAVECGQVKALLHIAGMSPHMAARKPSCAPTRWAQSTSMMPFTRSWPRAAVSSILPA